MIHLIAASAPLDCGNGKLARAGPLAQLSKQSLIHCIMHSIVLLPKLN